MSATVAVDAVDDALLDGLQSATLTVAQEGYVGDFATLDIEDHETLSIQLDTASIGEQAGAAAVTGIVSRSNTDLDQPLAVSLSNSDTSEILAPATLTIPAGEASISFTLDVLDDTLLDGVQTVVLAAAESRYDGGQALLEVSDHETVTLLLDSDLISEHDGPAAVQGTVVRSNSDVDQPLSIQLTNDDESEAFVSQTVIIPAGDASIHFFVDAVDDTLLDGTQTVVLTAVANGYLGDETLLQVADHETLQISAVAHLLAENAGPAATTATITRSNTDVGEALPLMITSSDDTELATLTSVTIEAGQASVNVPLNAIDDTLLDGTQHVVVFVSADGYFGGSQSIDVTDHETVELRLNVPSLLESDGPGAATATVTRSNTDTDTALVVNLAIDDPTELGLPETVSIAAYENSVTFFLDAVDDSLLDGTQSVVVTAGATGYFGSQSTLEVQDHELLTLQLDVSQFPENAELNAASATVTRGNTDWEQPLTVHISNGDTSELVLPAEVTIPAGQSAATFPVHTVDDTLLDGLQEVVIGAAAEGYVGAQQLVEVADYETLTLAVDQHQVRENDGVGVATVTLTRGNSDIDLPLVVLLSGDESEIGMPASVTIPAAAATVQFSIDAVDDDLLDGTQTVILHPLADGYAEFDETIDVTDHEVLTISVTDTVLLESDGQAARIATIARSNTDVDLPLLVAIANNDGSEIAIPLNATIPAGQASVEVPVDAVDDALLDGLQVALVSVQADGYVSDQLALSILDHETITLAFADGTLDELDGLEATTGSVTRSNTDNAAELVVVLQGADPTEVTVPSQVTIPAGQFSASFPVDAIDDQIIDGAQTMTVTASASGYEGGAADLEVLDNAFPWQNSRNPLDVDNDGLVAPVDALIVINYLNTIQGSGQLPAPPASPPPFYDTSGDNVAAPQDALLVINFLNRDGNGEGEVVGAAASLKPEATSTQGGTASPARSASELCYPVPRDTPVNRRMSSDHVVNSDVAPPPSWNVGPVAGQPARPAIQTSWEELLNLLAADVYGLDEPWGTDDKGEDDDMSL